MQQSRFGAVKDSDGLSEAIPFFQDFPAKVKNLVDFYALEAPQVDGAFSQKAGTAFNMFVNHMRAAVERSGSHFIG